MHRHGLSSQMKHKAAVSLTRPPSLSLPFIILIVITADNASNERRVGSLQADAQIHPKSIALFIDDPGDEPDFVKGRRGNDRSDFQGISRTWVHSVSFTRMEV